MVQEGYLETTFEIKNHKVKARINKDLAKVAKKIKTFYPFESMYCKGLLYHYTLNRAGVSRDDIGEMLGHSNSIVTEH